MTAFPFVFSNPANSAAALLPLEGLGLIRASGPEARSFLQSQLTNDAKLITPTQAQLSGYCNPKGRLLAVFTVIELGIDDFGLALPLPLVAATLKRLKMFVLRSQLVLSDASAALPTLGLVGQKSAAALSGLGLAAPDTDYGAASADGIWLLRRPGPVPRFELRAAPERLAALRLALNLPAAAPDDWALAELLAGTPQVVAETVDQFLAQAIDLDSRAGVSFTKGCYPGQEIVARVHYLGRIKQRLRLATASAMLKPGTAVLDENGQNVGAVMATALHPEHGALLALSLNLSHAGSAALHTADSAVQITPQPQASIF